MKKPENKRFFKKILTLAAAAALTLGLLTGCGQQEEPTTVRIGGLKGPTSMGLVFLQEQAENGQAKQAYEFTMAAAADELLPLMIKGELDIALIPANVASVLYGKTEGGISVLDINTLGVLYMVSGDDSIDSMESLRGRTIYLTGKGTTPDYVLQYLLTSNGIDVSECTLEYRSEATEVAALLAEQPQAIGLLPQPFVTVACAQNEELKVVLDMNEQWNLVQGEGGSSMVTGVTVVRNDFLQEHPEAVAAFMTEHAASVQAIQEDPDKGAELVVAAGIIAKEPIARKAIPQCNITCIDGENMRQALSGYLQVLYDLDPQAVGGALPEESFYYIP
ncbi:MAG: ABC transporter substrate-binding protein [Lachnospiraceae bacterium]|nr:ABC transporter substrate-binding protein [Lachnospiraceae bacterium]